jgi:phosphatidylserine/phosphatidylglycerophosphate/cardiolipin synthase-like enzyme
MGLLAAERARQQRANDGIQMVWTGPDQEGPAARDTGVVARELLGQASRSLLITTFSISRDATTFEPVNEAMRRNNDLDVMLVLHIDMSRHSLYGEMAIAAFARDFWASKWPWPLRPKVFFDPRGTEEHPIGRALQHSKCIVADMERVLITSSNYTESGHLRNIELGVLISDERLAKRVVGQFRSLIAKGLLHPLPCLADEGVSEATMAGSPDL